MTYTIVDRPTGKSVPQVQSHLLVLAAGIAVGMLLSTEAWGQWTQFGGPTQAFTADSQGLAKEWPKGGPPKLWSRELGAGYSSILVDDGRLYTMYRVEPEERVVSLDAATGKTLWEFAYASSPLEVHESQYGRGPNATPLLTGGRLYTVGIAGVMHCLNAADGKVIWTRKLWHKPRVKHPHKFGYSASPIEYKDMVIVTVGEKGRSIVALNKKDGSVVYEALDYANSYSTPVILKIHSEDQLVAFMGSQAIGANPNTGELEWEFPIDNQWSHNICPPLLIGDDTVFFSTLEAGSRALKLVKRGGRTMAEELWSTRKLGGMFFGWVQVRDLVIGSSGDLGGYLFGAINTKTGRIAWRKRNLGHASVVHADGRLIILSEEGRLRLATPTADDLTIDSTVKLLTHPSWTVPTIVGKTMYLRDTHDIMALDLG